MIEQFELLTLCLLLGAALLAGFVDAVAGGGGLIQVPALAAFVPQLPLAAVLGTNKLSSIFGTAAALWRYRSMGLVRVRIWSVAIGAAGFGALIGAIVATMLDPTILRPLVIVLTVVVLCYTLFGIRFSNRETTTGSSEAVTPKVRKKFMLGFFVGSYDGFYGPGAGSFLVTGLVKFFGMDALRASSAAKTINLASNAGALSWFVWSGNVHLQLGLAMAGFNLVGGLVGSHLAGKVGPPLVRAMLLLVVSALLIKLVAQAY